MNRRAMLTAMASAAILPATPSLASSGGGNLRANILMAGSFSMMSSELALRKARNPGLRNFARLELEEQQAVAAVLGARGPAPLDQRHAALMAQLEAAPAGSSFDALYLQGQVRGHEELLALNSSARRTSGTPAIVGTLAVPAIRTHLAMLRGMGRSAMS